MQDVETDQLSVFHLVEEISTAIREVIAPFEIYSWWSFEPDELNVIYDIRLEVYMKGALVAYSPPVPFQSDSRRQRLRIHGLPIPPDDGDVFVRLAHRCQEKEWIVSKAFWLICVDRPNIEATFPTA